MCTVNAMIPIWRVNREVWRKNGSVVTESCLCLRVLGAGDETCLEPKVRQIAAVGTKRHRTKEISEISEIANFLNVLKWRRSSLFVFPYLGYSYFLNELMAWSTQPKGEGKGWREDFFSRAELFIIEVYFRSSKIISKTAEVIRKDWA